MTNLDENGLIILSKKVSLKPYIPRTPKPITLLSDTELLDGVGGTMIVDSEVYWNYYLIMFKCIRTNKVVVFRIDSDTGECFNERKLSWLLHNYTCVGFNSIKFDFPLMWLAYVNQDTKTIKKAANDLTSNIWYQEVAKEYGFKVFDTPHVDLFEVAPLRGSLKLYGGRLHAPRIQDLPFDHLDHLAEWQKPIVDDYCLNDLDTTQLLMENLLEQLTLRHNLTIEYNSNCMSKSDAQIAEAVIGNELRKLTGKWPSKPKIDDTYKYKFQVPHNMFFITNYMKDILARISEFNFSVDENGRLERDNPVKDLKINIGNAIYRMGIGGLHSSEENISHKSDDEGTLYDRDVASYYPAIVLNCKLFPKSLGEDFLKVYSSLVDRRLAAKKAKRIAESENLKVTINGTFGKTGSPYSFLYAPEMTIQITVGGQLYLLMLIEKLELEGIPVVSANTDGILIKCPHNKREEMLDIVRMWETITDFVTEETIYEAIYSRDVNAYIAVKRDKDKVEFKGKNVYYDPWRGKSAKDKYWRFQKNPTAQICIEAIEELIANNVPIETTIKASTDITKFVSVKNVKGGAHKDGNYLGKVVRWYYGKGEKGTINYIESGNKVADTDGAVPAMDLPETFPLDMDYDWYIKRATELLYEMDFLKRPRQITFF